MTEGWFSPHDISRRVGSLLDISATEAKINITKAGSGEETWVLGTRLPIGEVNEFVFIDCGQHSILARIVKVWLESGERLSVDTLDDAKPSNNPIGLVQLLVSVDVETGQNHKGIKRYPKLGAQVYSAHPKLVSLLAEGGLNTSDSELQLPIAEMPHDSSINISVTPEKLFARHCAVLGSTGGGKSYTMANLMENVLEQGGKVLLLDATGEFSELDCKHYYVGESDGVDQKYLLSFPHWQFTDSDIHCLLRPSAQSQAPKLEEAIRSLKLVGLNQQRKFQDVLIENHLLIKRNQEKKGFEAAVSSAAADLKGAVWRFEKLSEQIIEECLRIDWKNSGKWGDISENDTGFCLSLISRINAMSKNPNLNWMLDADPNLRTIPQLIDYLAGTNDSQIIRLDLSNVPFEANSRETLVNAIGRKLLDCARKGTINNENPLLVFIDEAHQFLNKSIGDEHNRFELDAFGNIAKEGRKYGLNVIIATQRPRDIPEDVLSQIGTLIVHRLTNEKDQDIVRRAVGAIDQRSASFLPVLGQGEALLLGVDFPFPMTVKMKMPKAKPNSKSASFSQAWKIVQKQ